MKTLFNDNWQFAELPIDEKSMFDDGKPVLFEPEDFFEKAGALSYIPVTLPHDWQIYHVMDLYRSSVGFYKKTFELDGGAGDRYIALNFEGVYMNSAVW